MTSADVTPFQVAIGDDEIADLRARLARTRWPDAETVDDWSQGVPLAYVRELCAWWADGYDFGVAERVNAFPQVRAQVDGLGIHALHVRSPEPDALPLVLTHGWPGSVVEFLDVLGPLTDPRGARRRPRRRLPRRGAVAAGLRVERRPGRAGLGRRPHRPGVGRAHGRPRLRPLRRPGRRLGRGRDRQPRRRTRPTGWSACTSTCRRSGPTAPRSTTSPPTEQRALDDIAEHRATGTGYSTQQSTRPQTLGYGLADSPAGQCAWIVEKLWAWTDNDGHPESALTRQQILDDVSCYWFTGTATSSARLYWESFRDRNRDPITVPVGHLDLPGRDLPAVTPLGRAPLHRPPLVRDARPRRPLRRLGAARAVRRPGAGLLPPRALTLRALHSISPADLVAPATRSAGESRSGHAGAMRFSVWTSTNQPWAEVVATARHAEATGWDGVWVADHFMGNVGSVAGRGPDPRGGLGGRRPGRRRPAGAHRHPRLRQHLPAPGGAGQHGGDGRPRQRRPLRPRHRGRVAGQRARAVRHRPAARGRARRPVRGGDPDRPQPAPRADHHVRRASTTA